MYNSDIPSRHELPSSKQLIHSTLLAMITAAIILLTVILPAEYAIDPTGVGRWLGLTEMGEIKGQLAEELAADINASQINQEAEQSTSDTAPTALVDSEETPDQSTQSTSVNLESNSKEAADIPLPNSANIPAVIWRDEVRIALRPGQGTEIKLVMDKGMTANFFWEGVEGPLNYDTHGDTKGRSISYEKGRGVKSDEGKLTAAFTGNHGWFFRNRTQNDVTLVLKMRGDYKEVKRML